MKHSSKQRPGLPSSTPFLSKSFSLSIPWHAPTLGAKVVDGETLSSGRSTSRHVNLFRKPLKTNALQQIERGGMSDSGSLLSTDYSTSSQMVDLNCSQLEAIRYELLRKTDQAEMITDVTHLAHSRMKAVDIGITKLRDSFVYMDRVCASGQRSVEKLIAINMMLIDTLDALGLQPSSDKGLSKLMIRLRSDLLPAIRVENSDSVMKLCNDDIHSINAKLKEGMLIMSREYYGSKKSMKTIFGAYEELRCALRVVEQKNR